MRNFWICLACALGLAFMACNTDTDTWTPPERSLPELPVQVGAPNLVCFGNSLTAGYIESGAHGAFDDWPHAPPHYLAEKIKANVYNLGKTGDKTSDGLARIDEALAYHPKLVIIELGANDFLAPVFAAMKGGDVDKAKVPVPTTKENLEAILNKFNEAEYIWVAKFYTPTVANALKSIVTKPYPLWQTPPYTEEEFNACIEEYDAMFTELTAAKNIGLIDDIWSGVWGQHMSGMIHPDAAGYKIMADNYFNTITP